MDFSPAEETGRDALVLEDLSVGYGELVLLEKINITLRYGRRAALIGPNGSGKTTLVRTIIGQIPPLRGTVRHGAGEGRRRISPRAHDRHAGRQHARDQ